MIVGLDHLALNCSDFPKGLEALESIGYRTLFVEKEILNALEKRSFLKNFSSTHSIAYLESGNNQDPFIEITHHGQALTSGLGYKILKPSWGVTISDHQIASSSMIQAALLEEVSSKMSMSLWRNVTTNCGYDFGGTIVVTWVSEIETSMRFWIKALNFREFFHSGEGQHFYMLKMSSPLPGRSLFLIILSARASYRGHLDELGCSCLCFVTTDLWRDREALIENEYIETYSEPFVQEINDRKLLIELYRTTQGELIELVQYGPSEAFSKLS